MVIREYPFNLKGGGAGVGLWFFSESIFFLASLLSRKCFLDQLSDINFFLQKTIFLRHIKGAIRIFSAHVRDRKLFPIKFDDRTPPPFKLNGCSLR